MNYIPKYLNRSKNNVIAHDILFCISCNIYVNVTVLHFICSRFFKMILPTTPLFFCTVAGGFDRPWRTLGNTWLGSDHLNAYLSTALCGRPAVCEKASSPFLPPFLPSCTKSVRVDLGSWSATSGWSKHGMHLSVETADPNTQKEETGLLYLYACFTMLKRPLGKPMSNSVKCQEAKAHELKDTTIRMTWRKTSHMYNVWTLLRPSTNTFTNPFW